MNRKFVSKSNLVLRKVLNSKENLDILQDFIESILKIEIQKIELNPYLKSKEKYLPKEENFGVADVRIQQKNKEELNVGIQFIDGYYIQNKMLLYYAQIHANQLEHNKNRKVARTITINILDYDYFKTQEYHKTIKVNSKIDENGNSEEMEFHVLELPKFQLIDIENMTKEQAWMIFFCGNNPILLNRVIKKFDKIKKLDNLLEKYWEEEIME